MSLCGDPLDQDGWEGRCRRSVDHDGSHEGPCFRAERSEVADLCWRSADDEQEDCYLCERAAVTSDGYRMLCAACADDESDV